MNKVRKTYFLLSRGFLISEGLRECAGHKNTDIMPRYWKDLRENNEPPVLDK
jgi:hypothetical protein